MKNLKCWKKSQTSSGYYKGFDFINFRQNKNGYDVELRKGLGHPSKYKVIAKTNNKKSALKSANSYMKRHDKC